MNSAIHRSNQLVGRPRLRKSLTHVWAAGSAMITASCGMVTTTPAPPQERSVSATLPLVRAMPQSVETQHKGGVTITVAPITFDTQSVTVCQYGFAAPTLFTIVPRGASAQTHQKFVENRFDNLRVAPTDLSFLITIRNQMPRVFRGAGAVVQFNVDQRTEATDQSNYVDFINALIPPSNQTQIKIRGPSLSALRDSATLVVQLFDVVTAIDNAGNVAKRENFEWFFTVRSTRISRRVPLASRDVWIPNGTASTIAEGTPATGRKLRGRVEPTCLGDVVTP